MKLIIFTIVVVISAFLLRDNIQKIPEYEIPNIIDIKEWINSVDLNSLSSFLKQFSSPTLKVNAYKNGFEEPTTEVIINKTKSFAEIQNEIGSILYPERTFNKVSVYNEIGDILSEISQITNNMDVYVAIDDELFMHPGKYIGYNKTVGNITMITLSLSPRVFLVKNFLSAEECDTITAEASTYEFTHRSVVYQEDGGDDGVSTTRTSSTAYVPYPKSLITRSFNLTKMPNDVTYLYPDYHLQVIHYNPNQYFHAHHDGFFLESVGDERWFEQAQRNRYLTLFLYLNDVEEGGETAFIEYDDYVKFYEQADKYDVHTNNPCDTSKVKMTPSKGDGILFYNLKAGGQMIGEIDWNAVHTGCGVKKGEKWACNVWMYNRPTNDPEYVGIMKDVGLLQREEQQNEEEEVATDV